MGEWDSGTVGEWDDSADKKKSHIPTVPKSHCLKVSLSHSPTVQKSRSPKVPKSQSLILLSSQNQPTRADTLSSHATITAQKIVANTALGASNYLLMVVMLCYSIIFSSDVRISALPIEVMFTSSAVPE